MRTLPLLLLLAAAAPARAQTGDTGATAADTVSSTGGDAPLPTFAAVVSSSWDVGFSDIARLADALDDYPGAPAGQQTDRRHTLVTWAATNAGMMVERTRFSFSYVQTDAQREANFALLQNAHGLMYHLGRISHEALEGTDDGTEPDWHGLAATLREMAAQTRATLDPVGITLGL